MIGLLGNVVLLFNLLIYDSVVLKSNSVSTLITKKDKKFEIGPRKMITLI